MTSKLDRLQLITTFLAVAEAGNLSAAARALGTTQPTVSRRLRDLEQLLGARLASRSTHRFYLTAEGEELQRRAVSWADVWSEWEHVLKTTSGLPRGKLTLAGPQGYGNAFLMEAVAIFRAQYPEVEVELRLTDRIVDIVGQGIDCWIRVGGSRDQALHVRRIGQMRRILVASTSLARRHRISRPEDLSAVPVVGLIPHVQGKLVLVSKDGGQRAVPVLTPVSTDGLLASYRAIQEGLGVGGSALWLCGADIRAGRIRRVLPGWELTPIPIEAVSVAGRFRPARINAFVDILEGIMNRLDGFDPAQK
jgi:DNA-binding transcriptional LysR family regulator